MTSWHQSSAPSMPKASILNAHTFLGEHKSDLIRGTGSPFVLIHHHESYCYREVRFSLSKPVSLEMPTW